MKEVWLTYLKVKPEDSTWAKAWTYTWESHHAALDKTVDVEEEV